MSKELKYFLKEDLPEWLQDEKMEATRQFMDGCGFSADVVKHGMCSKPPLPPVDQSSFEGMDEKDRIIEALSGCLLAYLSAMSQSVKPEIFTKYIGILPEVIGQTLQQMGCLPTKEKEYTEAVGEQLKEIYEEKIASTKQEGPPDYSITGDVAEEGQDLLTTAISKLKAAGRGLVH